MHERLAFALATCLAASTVAARTAEAPREPDEKSATVELAGAELRFTGEITPSAVDKLEELLLAPAGSNVATLRINSTGGDADAGLRLAGLIRDRKLDVMVERICATTCAIYALPAAKRAAFADGAMMAFDFMPSPLWRQLVIATTKRNKNIDETERTQRLATIDEMLASILPAQHAFYRSLGVDPSRVYQTVDITLELRKALRDAGKPEAAKDAGWVPNQQFLRECLGFTNVVWREFEPADSAALAHIGRSPLTFLIGGRLHFEGKPISPKNYECKSRPAAPEASTTPP